ncbi:hypothetical protein FVR03_11350 [Pontibacter qinzhouensis]|uniref:Uncharacterized protein n=1 Tax=Pontibacter qinzhouensis TaxID=2603253 RepID=A0A5C8K913_9BACT|nr:hypothetical protein [Pontibacter qinzhouensis]TXK45895.1 hypothetical protein FVR03_11350 [Pontibacter qinzhouensis]
MDVTSIIIGLAAVALFIVPILYVQHTQKAKKQKLLQDFEALAGQQKLTISQHDFWDPYYTIGIDSTQNMLFYTLRKEGQEQQQVLIDLAAISACTVRCTHREANGEKIIERVDLVFTNPNSRPAEKTLEFYNREVNLNFNNELMLAEKWKSLVVTDNLATPGAGRGEAYKVKESM